jgi:hypothetical protein
MINEGYGMIAAITMVYNEPEFLPLWVEYYGKQVGYKNCYVIDHGSDDGSIEQYRELVNVVTIPREHKDNLVRTRFVTLFCNALLEYHSTIVNTDVDEFIIPDPRLYSGLADYCIKTKSIPAINSIGLNVTHVPSMESDINLNQPILSQRQFVRFVSPMCKPSIINQPIEFTSGFHGSNYPVRFKDLFMLHLRYFDKEQGLKRLSRTRNMKWSSDKSGVHQRVEDETWISWFSKFEKFKRYPNLFSEKSSQRIQEHIDELVEGTKKSINGNYQPKMLTPNELHILPDEFRTIF